MIVHREAFGSNPSVIQLTVVLPLSRRLSEIYRLLFFIGPADTLDLIPAFLMTPVRPNATQAMLHFGTSPSWRAIVHIRFTLGYAKTVRLTTESHWEEEITTGTTTYIHQPTPITRTFVGSNLHQPQQPTGSFSRRRNYQRSP